MNYMYDYFKILLFSFRLPILRLFNIHFCVYICVTKEEKPAHTSRLPAEGLASPQGKLLYLLGSGRLPEWPGTRGPCRSWQCDRYRKDELFQDSICKISIMLIMNWNWNWPDLLTPHEVLATWELTVIYTSLASGPFSSLPIVSNNCKLKICRKNPTSVCFSVFVFIWKSAGCVGKEQRGERGREIFPLLVHAPHGSPGRMSCSLPLPSQWACKQSRETPASTERGTGVSSCSLPPLDHHASPCICTGHVQAFFKRNANPVSLSSIHSLTNALL